MGIEYNTEFEKENDDMLEENHMTEMIYEKTISIKCHRNIAAAVISDEVDRRSSIPRDMIRLVHKGKMLSEKKTMKENNIEAEATIEMSLRLLGGMEMNEQMDTHETEEDREKKRKLEEGKEGKATKPNDDMVYLKRDIMEALKRSEEKWKDDSRMDDFSRKADEMYSKSLCWLQTQLGASQRDEIIHREYARNAEKITTTVGNQIQGMNSSIVSMQEMNEKITSTVGNQIQGMNSSIVKMKEEGDNKFNQFDERITNMERKILDMDEKYEHRSEDNKKEHVDENQGKTVITGFHRNDK